MLSHSGSVNSVSALTSSTSTSHEYSRKSSLEQSIQPVNYLNKLSSIQRNRSYSASSTSTPKYSSGRRTPNGRIGNNNGEGSTSSASSSSKLYSKYKIPSSSTSSSLSKIGIGATPHSDSDNKSKLSSSYNSSMFTSSKASDIPTSSKTMYSNNGTTYSGRKSRTPTPSSYSKFESRIPSPSPYSKRSITPY